MKIAEIKHPVFDPDARIKDGRVLSVHFTTVEWATIERSLERHVTRDEIHELIMGVFAGRYKVVKR